MNRSFIELQHAYKNCVLCLTCLMCRCLCHRLTGALFPVLLIPLQRAWQMALSSYPRRSVLAYWSLVLIFAICSSSSRPCPCDYRFHPERILNHSRMIAGSVFSVLMNIRSSPFGRRTFLCICLSANHISSSGLHSLGM